MAVDIDDIRRPKFPMIFQASPIFKSSNHIHIERKKKAYSTMYSRAVAHRGTHLARCCLTYEIRRERVFSAWYGRRHWPYQKAKTPNDFLRQVPFWKVQIIFTLKEKKAYSTKFSQAVTRPSTNLAQCCLTEGVRRELVRSAWYGRSQRWKISGKPWTGLFDFTHIWAKSRKCSCRT